MFGTQSASVIEKTVSGDMMVNAEKLGDAIRYSIEYILAAIFADDRSREVIV